MGYGKHGAVAALATGLLAWALPATMQVPLLAGLLWLTVGMYMGMALMDSRRRALWEFAGGIPVLALAMGAFAWPWLLVVAWLVHPVWDLLHDPGPISTKIHPATVPFCIVYDVAVAAVAATVVWSL